MRILPLVLLLFFFLTISHSTVSSPSPSLETSPRRIFSTSGSNKIMLFPFFFLKLVLDFIEKRHGIWKNRIATGRRPLEPTASTIRCWRKRRVGWGLSFRSTESVPIKYVYKSFPFCLHFVFLPRRVYILFLRHIDPCRCSYSFVQTQSSRCPVVRQRYGRRSRSADGHSPFAIRFRPQVKKKTEIRLPSMNKLLTGVYFVSLIYTGKI